MDDKTISVTLTGPAKINGTRKPSGATVSVSTTLALQLAASGVINPELARTLAEAMQDTPLASDFEAAVEAAAAERVADLATEAAKTAQELDAAQAEIAALKALLAKPAVPEQTEPDKAGKATKPAKTTP